MTQENGIKYDNVMAFNILDGEEKEIIIDGCGFTASYALNSDKMSGAIEWVGTDYIIWATPFWEDHQEGIPVCITTAGGDEIEWNHVIPFSNKYKSKTAFREAYYTAIKQYIENFHSPEKQDLGKVWLKQNFEALSDFALMLESHDMYDELENTLMEMDMELEKRATKDKVQSEIHKDIEMVHEKLSEAIDIMDRLAKEEIERRKK